MATNLFSGEIGRNFQLQVTINTKSQDVKGNYSIVTLAVYLRSLNGYYLTDVGNRNLTININGDGEIVKIDSSVASNQTKLIFAKDYKIYHNNDGTKSFTSSVKLDINSFNVGSSTVTQPVYLAKITRISTVKANNAAIGSDTTITIDTIDSSYTHDISYSFKNKKGSIAKGVTNSTVWTIPVDFANDLPDAISGTVIISADTFSGETYLGTETVTITVTIPDSYLPVLNDFILSETNTIVSNIIDEVNHFAQIYSLVKVNMASAIGIASSTITGFNAEIVGKNINVTSNGGIFPSFNFYGEFTVRGTVTDSRGRESKPLDKKIIILEYKPPALNFTAARSGSSSSIITVTRNARISPLLVNGVQKNIMKLTFKTAPIDGEFTTDNGPASGAWSSISSLTNSSANLANSYAPDKSYKIKAILTDSLGGSTTFEAPIITAEKVVFSYDQQGVGIGKPREFGVLDVVGTVSDVFIGNKSILDIFYPVGTIYESVKTDNPATFMGGTWTRFGNGKVLVGVDETDTDFNASQKIGGEKTHQLTNPEMPSHVHPGDAGMQFHMYKALSGETATDGVNSGTSFKSKATTGSAGGNQPHNNLQPYVTVYRWQRTA